MIYGDQIEDIVNMCIDDVLARVLHVIAVMAWIGGVWFVTWVVLPAVEKNSPPDERLAAFHRIEAGFAPIARLWVLLAGVSGLWMVWRADWARFADPRFWWMLAMVGLWLIFALMFLSSNRCSCIAEWPDQTTRRPILRG
jgi:uncharacterized membrane protein